MVGIAANAQLFATKSLGGSPTRCSSGPTARPLRPDDLTLRPCICSRRLTPNLGPQTRHQGSAPVNMDADQVFMSHLTNELRRCVREDGDKSDAS